MRPRGFTLIELLVVMTLLALLMVGLISAMRTMAQTETKIDQRLQRLDDLRTVRAFLLQTLSQVSAAKLDVPNSPGKTMVPFVATPNSLTWVGTLPARPGAGGCHYFRLAVEGEGHEQALMLRFAPCSPDLVPPDWTSADGHLLLRDIAGLAVQAQGLPSRAVSAAEVWPKGWQSGWPMAQDLPQQVRLQLSDAAQGELASWTVALHTFPQSDDTLSIVVIGGSRR